MSGRVPCTTSARIPRLHPQPGVLRLQVLINNAGMLERCTLEDVSEEAMLSSYKINCMGPLFTVQALLKQKLFRPGALIANVTSLVCPSLCHH